jgi:hypothetical protein
MKYRVEVCAIRSSNQLLPVLWKRNHGLCVWPFASVSGAIHIFIFWKALRKLSQIPFYLLSYWRIAAIRRIVLHNENRLDIDDTLL